MKAYSRQLDRFIECELYATSAYRKTDGRTWCSYVIDKDGMIHSSSFNYSIVSSKPVSKAQFEVLIEDNEGANVIFVQPAH